MAPRTPSKHLGQPKAHERVADVFANGAELTHGDVVQLTGIGYDRVGNIVRYPHYREVGKRGRATVWRKA